MMKVPDVWQELLAGNRRFAVGKPLRPNQSVVHREKTALAQQPAAAILTCGDSRVIPEMLFDQGIGDLFVLRTPGAILDRGPILGGIEFAVRVLNIELIVVLGHQLCGAILSTLEATRKETPLPGHIEYVAEFIRPAIQKTRDMQGDPLELAIRANIQEQMRVITETEPMANLIREGKLRVEGGYYSHQFGLVESIGLNQPLLPIKLNNQLLYNSDTG